MGNNLGFLAFLVGVLFFMQFRFVKQPFKQENLKKLNYLFFVYFLISSLALYVENDISIIRIYFSYLCANSFIYK